MVIPTPPQSGSAGTQQPEHSSDALLEPYAPLAGLPLAQRVEGLAATRPRNLGGEVAATLIAGSFSQLSDDLRQQRELAQTATSTVSRLQEELGASRTHAAVLEERLHAVERTQTIKQIGVLSGTALLAVAIDLYKANLTPLAVITGVLGVALLLVGWVTRHGGPTK